jgi:hypothetical protein
MVSHTPLTQGKGLALALLGGALAVLTACTAAGVPKADYDAVMQQITAKDADLAAAQQKLADLQKASAATADVTPIYSVRKVPPAEARPPVSLTAPIAVPAGLPPTYSQPVGPYTMYMETIASAEPSRYGLLAALGCVQENVFKRGMKMVFRMELYDMATGKRVTPADQPIVKVKLSNNQEAAFDFNRRGGPSGPPDAPWMWVTTWNIPTDFPVGAVDYTVSLTTKDGKTTDIKPPVLLPATGLRIID